MSRLTEPLMLKFRPGLVLSDAEFGKLCASHPELRLELSSSGELEIMAPASSDTGGRNFRLTVRLGYWVEATGREKAFDSSAGFTLPNGAIRSPDASWIDERRWNLLPPEEHNRFARICPDFVVELRSPTDRKSVLRRKMREYLDQGARLGWLIDPLKETVEVYRTNQPVEVLARPSTLSGEAVLPGFVLDLKGILFD
ncbi:Uma2 family endonuclease [Singulisphaera rosea]